MRHGGDIDAAATRYGIAPEQWLDLSTGINPIAYPLVPPDRVALTRLPSAAREVVLRDTARVAYDADAAAAIVAAPGSQILIQLTARLRSAAYVAILSPTYSEHAIAWAREGARVRAIAALDEADDADIVVLANPNNPDGRRHAPADLRDVANRLAARGGLLVVDEAFADVAPDISMAPQAGRPGLLVLRSFGKMYGLAGVRLGFALGADEDIAKIAGWLGPWAVPGPAIEAGITALGDRAWTAAARATIHREADALARLLVHHGLEVVANVGLFVLAQHSRAGDIAEHLARHGIWVRTFDYAATWLRFGLPGGDEAMARLGLALSGSRFA